MEMMDMVKNRNDLDKIKNEFHSERKKSADTVIVVGMGTCGIAAGAENTITALENEIERKNIKDIELAQTGCMGYCVGEPLVEIRQGDVRILYEDITAEKVEELVEQHIVSGNIINRWRVPFDSDFFEPQERIVLKNCGVIDPESIRAAISHGSYKGLAKALKKMKPEGIIDEIEDAKLRGRGGGGFPTGLKSKPEPIISLPRRPNSSA